MSFLSVVDALTPTHHWRLSETSGTTATDRKAGATGTYASGPVLNQTGLLVGDASPSVAFDGINDRVTFGDIHDFAVKQPFSLVVWVDLHALDTQDRRILSKYSSSRGWRWTVQSGRIDFQRYDSGGTLHQTTYRSGPGLGRHMLAMTFDGATVRLYVDRTLVVTDVTGAVNDLPNTALNMVAASDHDVSAPLNANMQDVLVWDGTVLGEFDVYAVYDAGLSQTPPGANVLSTGRRRCRLPVGGYNVNNQPLSLAAYRMGIRFVLDRPTTCYRWIQAYNCEGTTWLTPTDPNHARGTGGRNRVSIVRCKANGEPDLTQVLAQDEWDVVTRYAESKTAFGVASGIITELLYSDMGGVLLPADTLLAAVTQNMDASPDLNHVSTNCPAMREDVAGPHNANTLDKHTAGALMGLDPREAVCWSQNAGSSWTWGWQVGGGSGYNSYDGHAAGLGLNQVVRMPWYGIQEAAGQTARSNSPFTAYQDAGPIARTLKCKYVPRDCTLTRAGGMTRVTDSLGVLTVTNLRTGASGVTTSLGDGLVEGAITPPVPVVKGDAFTIASSGPVPMRRGDDFVRNTFGVGATSLDWPFESGAGYDVPNLYVLDELGAWPYYARPVVTGAKPRGV